MEPVQPTPSPEVQTDAQAIAPARGPLARVKGAVGGLFSGGSPDSSQATTSALPTLEPQVPGLQPRPDNTPATGAVVPSPWASPDTAAVAQAAPAMPDTALASEPVSGIAIAGQTPGLTREPQGPTLAHDWLSNPAAPLDTTATVATEPSTVEPTPAPEPTIEPAADTANFQPEPIAATEPAIETEPTPTVSPVWTPDASPAQPNTAIEPDMRPSSSPSVEPIDSAAVEPKDTEVAVAEEGTVEAQGEQKTAPEVPLIRKVVDGDLIRYEFTPEGLERVKSAITKAIDSGAFNDLATAFAQPNASEAETTITPAAGTQSSIPIPPTPPANPMAQTESDALRAVSQGTPGNPTPISSSFS